MGISFNSKFCDFDFLALTLCRETGALVHFLGAWVLATPQFLVPLPQPPHLDRQGGFSFFLPLLRGQGGTSPIERSLSVLLIVNRRVVRAWGY
jgi:hypothetical protein